MRFQVGKLVRLARRGPGHQSLTPGVVGMVMETQDDPDFPYVVVFDVRPLDIPNLRHPHQGNLETMVVYCGESDLIPVRFSKLSRKYFFIHLFDAMFRINELNDDAEAGNITAELLRSTFHILSSQLERGEDAFASYGAMIFADAYQEWRSQKIRE
jgi:hypothetical protein